MHKTRIFDKKNNPKIYFLRTYLPYFFTDHYRKQTISFFRPKLFEHKRKVINFSLGNICKSIGQTWKIFHEINKRICQTAIPLNMRMLQETTHFSPLLKVNKCMQQIPCMGHLFMFGYWLKYPHCEAFITGIFQNRPGIQYRKSQYFEYHIFRGEICGFLMR